MLTQNKPNVHNQHHRETAAAVRTIANRVAAVTCGYNDSTAWLQATVAGLDIHELLQPNVSTKPGLQQQHFVPLSNIEKQPVHKPATYLDCQIEPGSKEPVGECIF